MRTLGCMEFTAYLFIAAVLATADLCTAPLEGGAGDPQFCHLKDRQSIETPFFSVLVEPDLFVGVDRAGRRLRVQPTLLREPAQFTIEVLDHVDMSKWSDCTELTETAEDIVSWHDCRIVSNGFYERRLAARLANTYVLIQYSYSTLGTIMAPSLERMTQSVRIHAN